MTAKDHPDALLPPAGRPFVVEAGSEYTLALRLLQPLHRTRSAACLVTQELQLLGQRPVMELSPSEAFTFLTPLSAELVSHSLLPRTTASKGMSTACHGTG